MLLSNLPINIPIANDVNSFAPSSSTDTKNDVEHVDIPPTKPKNKYRMRICDAPPELLEVIKRSEKMNEIPLSNKSISSNVTVKNVSTSTIKHNSNFHKIISVDKKRYKIRKNPYPKKSPSKSSPGITLQVDVYTTLKEDPKALLQRNNVSIPSSSNDSSSASENSNSPIPQRLIKYRRKKSESIITNKNPPLLNVSINKLMKMIEYLKLDTSTLQHITPKIKWKSKPISIIQLPYYKYLHPKEAHIATTLRLTPHQYLLAKYILISSARTAMKNSLPFRKSDAQKLLRIDVNKASKLWEWFVQTKWIQTYSVQ
jgi:hypothetical protein